MLPRAAAPDDGSAGPPLASRRQTRQNASHPTRERREAMDTTALAWGPCLLEPKRNPATEAWLRKETGTSPPWVRYYLGCPWVAKSVITLLPDNGLLVDLDFATADIVALVVSQENSCRYCYAVTRAQLRLLGMSEERMQALEQKLAAPALDSRGSAAVRFARRFARANPLALPSDLDELYRAGFSAGAARELAYVAAVIAYLNRLATFVAMPPQPWEQLADRWFVRIAQPLVAALVRRMKKRGRLTAAQMPDDVPFATVLQAFAGTPIAPALARTLHDAWESTLLPPRSRALMLAVIAHGLGSPSSCMEALRLAQRTGLSETELSAAVAQLGGPGVDERDRLLMQFARDTLWYEPQAIQQRTRDLLEHFGADVLLDAIGVAALGNAMCRLAAVLAPAA
jgi:AhpD family alkylhydroperoxidase